MSSHFRSTLLLLGLLALPFTAGSAAFAHGSHGGSGEALEAGEFDFTPILTIEGHGGFDTNLEGDPKHYAIDGLFGGVFEWGLGNGGSFAIEAAVGPALVWGEAEHFYGKVHVHDDHDDHDDHSGHDHHGHAHGEFDAHIWLDPMNAKEMVHEIAHELGDLDPANKNKYEANAQATIQALDQLVNDIEKGINKDARFVVFHDAYQYFEERFGVRAAGALTLNTDVLPGAKQIADIQDVMKDRGIKCIFSEPQFNPKIITTIAEDMNIKTGVFDPLGANIDSNKDLYFKLIQNLGNELKDC